MFSNLSQIFNLQGLLGPTGLMSDNHFAQEAAINSLSTLMSMLPGETYMEFEKVTGMVLLSYCLSLVIS